jgi:hypothetical protein
MWHHVTNHLIISNDKDSNSENRIKLRVRDISWDQQSLIISCGPRTIETVIDGDYVMPTSLVDAFRHLKYDKASKHSLATDVQEESLVHYHQPTIQAPVRHVIFSSHI